MHTPILNKLLIATYGILGAVVSFLTGCALFIGIIKWTVPFEQWQYFYGMAYAAMFAGTIAAPFGGVGMGVLARFLLKRRIYLPLAALALFSFAVLYIASHFLFLTK